MTVFVWVFDYKVMAHVADKIKLIDGSREALKLSIRITDLWFIGIPGKTEQAEMVVVDSDGDEIHVVCKQCDMEQLPFRKFRFVAFSSVIAGDFKIRLLVGSYPASVSNSFKASKLMINDLVLEIQEFRESLLDLGIEVRSIFAPIGQGSSQVSGSSQLSSKDVFLSKTEVKNISEINASSEEFVCVTVAKITTIVMNNYSWCYPACGQCYKKVDMQSVSFTCPCGKENNQHVLRYRVEVMVSHKGEQTKFLIWDCECAQLIGQSADEVNMLKIEDGDVDLNASPQALDRLLGCFLAFKVKVQPRFRNSVVLKYSDEPELINVMLDMIPDSEQSLSITADHDRSMLGSSEPTEFESQSVSVTGDHDPLLRIPLTPTKRVSSDELDNE
ncbi:hypothetical protein JHK87_024335 [Glycine soja]|nr:hypothetical protein JHK87_024335 [Glycine soja]